MLVWVAPAAVAGNTMSHGVEVALPSNPALQSPHSPWRGESSQRSSLPRSQQATQVGGERGGAAAACLSFLGPPLDQKVSTEPPTHLSGPQPLRPDRQGRGPHGSALDLSASCPNRTNSLCPKLKSWLPREAAAFSCFELHME